MKIKDFTTLEHLKDFNAFYNANYKPIYYYILKAFQGIDQRIELSEEVANDVFVKFEKNLSIFDFEKSSPNTYLHVIANCAIIDTFRKGNKHTNNIELDGENTFFETNRLVVINSDVAIQNISYKETKSLVENIIFKMKNDDHKKVSELFFFDDLSYQQIADICQISLANVKVILNRCRTQLQTELKAVR